MRRRAVLSLPLAVAGSALGTATGAFAAPGRTTTVFVAGDSTAATWPASAAPKAGWGQALPAFLGPRCYAVANIARSGASSKSFIELGLLDRILADIAAGDHLLISFGHNDEKSDDRHTDPYTTYQEYLSMYIDGARRHGARPVLVTPVERRRFDSAGHAVPSHGEYPQAMRDLGARTGVPVIDLTTLSMQLWDEAGVEGTKSYFLWLAAGQNPNYPTGVQDNTHFQAHGAIEVARLVVRGLVAQHVVRDFQTVNLDLPVADDALMWPDEVAAAP